MDAQESRKTSTFQNQNLLREAPRDFLQSLLQLLTLKDKGTFQHSDRVYQITQEWATYMRAKWQWTELHVETLATSALLHDIGKIGILDEILLKEGQLTAIERDQMEQHAEIGYQLIRDYPGIGEIASGIRHHHERWDGKGYPLGLKGERIPVFAQLIAIVDTYDAMTSFRSYQNTKSSTEALEEIKKEAGRQFNPDFVDSFLQFMHARNT